MIYASIVGIVMLGVGYWLARYPYEKDYVKANEEKKQELRSIDKKIIELKTELERLLSLVKDRRKEMAAVDKEIKLKIAERCEAFNVEKQFEDARVFKNCFAFDNSYRAREAFNAFNIKFNRLIGEDKIRLCKHVLHNNTNIIDIEYKSIDNKPIDLADVIDFSYAKPVNRDLDIKR